MISPIHRQSHPFGAALTMLCAMMVIGMIDNFIPRVAAGIGLWQFLFIRTLMSIPLIFGLFWLGLGRLTPERYWAVALRSILIAIAMLFYFSALVLMSIAQALAGLFTSPIFIC